MIIKAKIKGKETEITIPDSEYWIKRNKQRIIPYWQDADNLEKRINKEFLDAYKELEKELYTFAGKFGLDGQLTYSQKRIIGLMTEIKPHIDDLYAVHQLTLSELLITTYNANYLNTLYDLSSGTKIYGSFVGLNENAIKTAISFPWSGANFSDRIYNNKAKLINTLRTEITQSIIRGEGIKTTAKVVADRLDISRKNAGRLVQTEMGAVLTMSDKKAYEEYGMEEYEFVATMDNRTSAICRDLDGNVFKVSDMTPGLNASSMHVLCRSSSVPYFNDFVGKRLVKDLESNKYSYIDSSINFRKWEESFID